MITAEDFLPKNRTGKYSRNEYVSGAEAYAKHYAKELIDSISDEDSLKLSEEIYGSFKVYHIMKRNQFDGFATGVNTLKNELLKRIEQ